LLRPLVRLREGGSNQHDDKLFAAVAARHVLRPRPRAQQVPQDLKRAVAGLVPEAVVEVLEVVDVDHSQRDRPPGARRVRDIARQRLVEVAAVEQVGQGVADRLIAQSRLERRVCLKLGL